ncbi:uncharacterized protein LOC135111280 [Scylla paramamosain]|uniref:uncharacterized protein LOC135111280 n=1 Tax=Scylla paramamosain TaxID=85552 RepID=UPI003083ED1F
MVMETGQDELWLMPCTIQLGFTFSVLLSASSPPTLPLPLFGHTASSVWTTPLPRGSCRRQTWECKEEAASSLHESSALQVRREEGAAEESIITLKIRNIHTLQSNKFNSVLLTLRLRDSHWRGIQINLSRKV